MKIVISPAKSLDFSTALPTENYTQSSFLTETETVHATLVKQKPADLKSLMHISDALANLNWERNQQFQLPFTTANARQAVYAFSGDVYQGLDAYSLKPNQIESMQNTLLILSGLYGIVKPLDLIQPYRLEMGTKMAIGTAKNLYEFWKPQLTAYINSNMKSGELLVNLASTEYFSALDKKALQPTVIAPVFKDWKNDKLKIISFFAKKARGTMTRFLIENKAESVNDILAFAEDGYAYSSEYTTDPNQPVFVR